MVGDVVCSVVTVPDGTVLALNCSRDHGFCFEASFKGLD